MTSLTKADLEAIHFPRPRPICNIAAEIRADWQKPYFGAVPYMSAMLTLYSIYDSYGLDSARSILLYFLANAATWRGPTARRIKSELKEMLKVRTQGDVKMTTREQLTAIWNRPGVENPGHLNIWSAQGAHLEAKPGAKRRPAWDKALLKRARKELPNWYANKSKPY